MWEHTNTFSHKAIDTTNWLCIRVDEFGTIADVGTTVHDGVDVCSVASSAHRLDVFVGRGVEAGVEEDVPSERGVAGSLA